MTRIHADPIGRNRITILRKWLESNYDFAQVVGIGLRLRTGGRNRIMITASQDILITDSHSHSGALIVSTPNVFRIGQKGATKNTFSRFLKGRLSFSFQAIISGRAFVHISYF
jgi:hypothetical protein